jgi:acetylornithine deacetylase
MDVVDLLRALVAIPSVSGSEAALQSHLAGVLRAEGLDPRISGRNLVASAGSGDPVLLLNAHADTVPAAPSWTRAPWTPVEEGDRLFGLGSGDDKASLAAMALATIRWHRSGEKGTLLFASTCDEETGGEGLEVLRRTLPRIDAAIVGEPTGLRPATAQRGLIRIEAVAEGRSAHAARPHQGVNAIVLAMEDILRIRDFAPDDVHPLLGRPSTAVTLVQGGTARNMVPASCTFTVDARTTPGFDNARMVEALRARLRSRISVLRDRMVPVETAGGDPLVLAALAATGATAPIGFGGVSDLFHVRDVPCLVLGPGDPEQSHQADESVPLDQVRRAVDVYFDCARRWRDARLAGGAA